VCWSDPNTPGTGFYSPHMAEKGEYRKKKKKKGLGKRGIQKLKKKKKINKN
jgi:hypothetical protein